MEKQEIPLKMCQFSIPTAEHHVNHETQLAISHSWSWGCCLSLTGSMSPTLCDKLFWGSSAIISSINILI